MRARRPSRLTPVGSCYRSTCRRCFPHSRPTPLPPVSFGSTSPENAAARHESSSVSRSLHSCRCCRSGTLPPFHLDMQIDLSFGNAVPNNFPVRYKKVRESPTAEHKAPCPAALCFRPEGALQSKGLLPPTFKTRLRMISIQTDEAHSFQSISGNNRCFLCAGRVAAPGSRCSPGSPLRSMQRGRFLKTGLDFIE